MEVTYRMQSRGRFSSHVRGKIGPSGDHGTRSSRSAVTAVVLIFSNRMPRRRSSQTRKLRNAQILGMACNILLVLRVKAPYSSFRVSYDARLACNGRRSLMLASSAKIRARPGCKDIFLLLVAKAPANYKATSVISFAPPAKALVTGANGYVAVWVVRRLLEDGYSVRGTVRSADKATHLRELFGLYGDKLELVVLPDITEEGAFDEAVKGIDLVEHTASPFTYQADKADDLIAPGLKGTTGILNSIKKNAKYDESDWNDSSVEVVTKNPKESLPVYWYPASKTLGEKVNSCLGIRGEEQVRDQLRPSLTLLSYVFGPALHEVKTPMQLNQSLREIYQYVLKTKDTLPAPEGVYACIDVRDLAAAHVLSAKKPEASNNRLIVSGPAFLWEDIINIAAKSNVVDDDRVVKVTPSDDINENPRTFAVKTEKAEKLLELEWTSLEATVRDSLASFKEKSFI
ncbi:hypothetical protein EVG20_g10988 [Dentipellis fragilis]|uniref:NAD-dependent epimerase/dehydratase domain-containing protein n=1 Tax=Dentipellis fragilis TaxID=205917 RepID=A0A4Y9XQK6_9AGAM|nr:hypothetical protein EVG20_g10988 [Dentipellis fragilis]